MGEQRPELLRRRDLLRLMKDCVVLMPSFAYGAVAETAGNTSQTRRSPKFPAIDVERYAPRHRYPRLHLARIFITNLLVVDVRPAQELAFLMRVLSNP